MVAFAWNLTRGLDLPQVWRSTWMGVEVASKVLRLNLMTHHIRGVLLQGMEASVVSELSHPNVIRTFQIYRVCPPERDSLNQILDEKSFLKDYQLSATTAGYSGKNTGIAEQLWIVQEYCRGGDLSQAIREKVSSTTFRNSEWAHRHCCPLWCLLFSCCLS